MFRFRFWCGTMTIICHVWAIQILDAIPMQHCTRSHLSWLLEIWLKKNCTEVSIMTMWWNFDFLGNWHPSGVCDRNHYVFWQIYCVCWHPFDMGVKYPLNYISTCNNDYIVPNVSSLHSNCNFATMVWFCRSQMFLHDWYLSNSNLSWGHCEDLWTAPGPLDCPNDMAISFQRSRTWPEGSP